MECPTRNKEIDILLDYCARKTDAETAAALERHIAACAECRRFTAGQTSVWNALDTWDDIEISPDFNRRLYARIDELESTGWWARVWSDSWGHRLFGWRPAMSLITACLTVAIAFLLYTPTPQPQIEQKVSPQVVKEAVDLEQIERTLDDIEMLKQLTAPSSGRSTTM